MRILELPTCPACGAHAFMNFELGHGNHLRRCEQCDTVSAPEYADPAEVYVDGYMFGQNGSFGMDVREPRFQAYLTRVANRRVAMIEQATGMRSGSLLDVGSGTGEVLAAASQRGWRTQGVEPERTAAEMASARGLDVTVSLLEDAGLPERSFDVVSAFHVLEHVPDSRRFLTTLARYARPGGFITIEVPNFNSVQRRRLRAGWPHLRPNEHLVHFTPSTLAGAMRAVSIEPVAVRSPVYIGAPQTLDQMLIDLGREGRYRSVLERFSEIHSENGVDARYPNRVGRALLGATELFHDRAGVGAVVFCVGTVS